MSSFLSVFFQIGDCAFTDPNHHGTPLQRMRAAQFGFDVADQARKQGHILSSEEVHTLFVAAYPAEYQDELTQSLKDAGVAVSARSRTRSSAFRHE